VSVPKQPDPTAARRTVGGTPARRSAAVAAPRSSVFPTAWARTAPVRVLREVVQVAGLAPLVHSAVRLDVHGLEELDGFDRPALIVANHASHLDTAVLLATLPRARRRWTAVAAARDYFFDTWWRAGGSALAFNTFPIERGDTSRLATPGELLADGWSVVVFPEGTRSPDGFPGRFKLGAAWLAVQHQVPVIPVGLRGTYAAMPRGSSWPARGRPRVSVRYGTPIVPAPTDTVRQLAPRIAAAVSALVLEDATSWWQAQRSGTTPVVTPPVGSWRRSWQQSEAPVEGSRTSRVAIWRS
jgi:1-acyl-sn-glycerol-3-phosphate acyltransferase